MDPVNAASFLAAFIAGIAALFAPCCVTVLLPVYLSSIFRQRSTVLLMTFVFFLGLLTVFLPLGLGIAGLGQAFSKYHNLIYVLGGIFLTVLGSTILLGIHFSLPFSFNPNVKVTGAASVFVLGIFSGFATLCCAPVLAGVLALSALPGSVFLGGMFTVAYVLGMVVPLFILAYFIDRTDVMEKLQFMNKEFRYKIASSEIRLKFSEVLSGAAFLLMGILILYLAQANKISSHSEYQMEMNLYMAQLTDRLTVYIGSIPWFVLPGLVVMFVILFIVHRGLRSEKSKESEKKMSCCGRKEKARDKKKRK